MFFYYNNSYQLSQHEFELEEDNELPIVISKEPHEYDDRPNVENNQKVNCYDLQN